MPPWERNHGRGGRPLKALHLRRRSTGAAMVVLVLSGMALPFPIRAKDRQPTVQELQKEIRQRDELIRRLVHRVENLERQIGSRPPDTAEPATTGARRAAKSRPPRARPRSPRSIRESSRRSQRRLVLPVRVHPPARRSKPRAAMRRRPGSSKSAKTPLSARSNERSLRRATCWCRAVLQKSNPYSATRAAKLLP